MSRYRVKESFYSIQGEGVQAGRPAVFCRFSGCNLWSGRLCDKPQSPCPDCDTDFVGTDGPGGGAFDTPEKLAGHLACFWPQDQQNRYLVFTGGEPALQLDAELISACKRHGFACAIETNGTRPLPEGLDWVCVSPKPGAHLSVTRGDELKLLYPYGLEPAAFESLDFAHFCLQPVDNDLAALNRKAALDYCLANPRWRLSLQLHKILNVR
jgi:7-carboxy-7-deazaguanine synthase (Cx14CxxC type)